MSFRLISSLMIIFMGHIVLEHSPGHHGAHSPGTFLDTNGAVEVSWPLWGLLSSNLRVGPCV